MLLTWVTVNWNELAVCVTACIVQLEMDAAPLLVKDTSGAVC